MQKTTLKAETRTSSGTSTSKQMRANGQVPGILYGSHRETTSLTLDKSELERYVHGHSIGSKVYLTLDGEEIMAILKDVQRNVFGTALYHVDFQALTTGEKIRLPIHLYYVGKDKLPVDAIPQEMLSELEVETLPQFILDSLDVDVSAVTFNEGLTVADLPIMSDDNYKVLTDPSTQIFTLVSKTQFEEEDTESTDETAEPEVIGETE